MTKRSYRVRTLAGIVLCAVFAACGGGGSTTPTPVASNTPRPCTHNVLAQGQGPLPGESLGAVAFTTLAAGRIDVTVDWTDAASAIGVYVVQVAIGCDLQELSEGACTFVLESNPSSVKPRKVSVSAPVGSYELLIANFSPNDESVAVQIVLSLGECPAFGGSLPEAARSGKGPALALREVGPIR
jgi:hypothetical protein